MLLGNVAASFVSGIYIYVRGIYVPNFTIPPNSSIGGIGKLGFYPNPSKKYKPMRDCTIPPYPPIQTKFLQSPKFSRVTCLNRLAISFVINPYQIVHQLVESKLQGLSAGDCHVQNNIPLAQITSHLKFWGVILLLVRIVPVLWRFLRWCFLGAFSGKLKPE